MFRKLLRGVKISLVMLLIAIVTGELFLQLIALVVAGQGHQLQQSWATDNYRVLALGDSFVYGLYLEQHQAWPMQLEKVWNEDVPEGYKPIEMLNLGFPGTNSSRILGNIEAFMTEFRPDLVLIMVGANDPWTPDEDFTREKGALDSFKEFIRQESRMYRLWYMVNRQVFEQQQLETVEPWPDMDKMTQEEALAYLKERVERNSEFHDQSELPMNYQGKRFVMRHTQGEPLRHMKKLVSNYEAIQEIIHSYGSKAIFVSYPANGGFYLPASRHMQRAAGEGKITLIDVQTPFASNCPEIKTCPDQLFPDWHPKASGYEWTARFVRENLPGVLEADK